MSVIIIRYFLLPTSSYAFCKSTFPPRPMDRIDAIFLRRLSPSSNVYHLGSVSKVRTRPLIIPIVNDIAKGLPHMDSLKSHINTVSSGRTWDITQSVLYFLAIVRKTGARSLSATADENILSPGTACAAGKAGVAQNRFRQDTAPRYLRICLLHRVHGNKSRAKCFVKGFLKSTGRHLTNWLGFSDSWSSENWPRTTESIALSPASDIPYSSHRSPHVPSMGTRLRMSSANLGNPFNTSVIIAVYPPRFPRRSQ